MIAPRRYSTLAIALHWTIALALAYQFALGRSMADARPGGATFAAFELHKSLGMAILLLSLARLGIRVSTPRPAAADDNPLAQRLANAVHVAFYAVMIGGPLTGWAIVSTASLRVPTRLFGIVPLPSLPLPPAWDKIFVASHGLLAWSGVALFALHVAGAARHQLWRDRSFLGRMVPAVTAGAKFSGLGSITLIMGLLGAMALAFAGGNSVPVDTMARTAAPSTIGSSRAPEMSLAEAVAPTSGGKPVAGAGAAIGTISGGKTDLAEPAARWLVQPGGRIGFTAHVSGAPVRGSITRWTCAILFSPNDLDHSSIKVELDLASATTADKQRDEMLAGADFFAIAAHPSAVFRSRSIRHGHGDLYVMRGTLALKGVERPVTVTFRLKLDGDKARASGKARLDRTDFRIGEGDWANDEPVAFPVSIDFALTAARKPAGH